MKKFLVCLSLIFVIISSAFVCSAAPEPRASSAILASLSGQQIIYTKDGDKKLPPAEFTKLMTAYTTYKVYGLDKKLVVPDNIGDYTNYMENNMNLKPGEAIKASDLIYGMIMGQANDAAYTVGMNYTSIEAFIIKMNDYAKELGMTNTVFTNTTGRHDEKQYTTANDLLILYREFYKDKNLYPFLSTKNIVIPATNLSQERSYWTKNHLMSRFIYLDYIYNYADAGMSSSSSSGGYSVISSATKGKKELMCIVLNSVYENGVNYAMIDAQELFNYGFDKFTTVTVTKQGELLYEAKLKNHKGKNTVLLCAEKTVKGFVLDGDDISSMEKKVVIEEPVKAPFKKGQVVGKMVYTYQGKLVGEVNLVAERDVKRSIIKTIFSGIGWFFNLKAIKIILFIILCIIGSMFGYAYYKSRQRRRRRRNRRKKYMKF